MDGTKRRDLLPILVLLLIAGGIRFWLLCHTEVAARDSIGFIRCAWHYQHRPWPEVMRQAEPHPAYPLAILAASHFVRPFADAPEPIVMQFSAQLVSALAGLLLVVPMFYLGRELFDR